MIAAAEPVPVSSSVQPAPRAAHAAGSPRDLGIARARLIGHPIYGLVTSPDRLRRFMETHVFAVWDFQSLLKAMQQRLTCTSLPWVPTADPEARRLVNEIVLDEESDELPEPLASRLGLHGPDGPPSALSHFELYQASMRQAGADTGPIDRLVRLVSRGTPLDEALDRCGAPPEAVDFVRHTFAVIGSGTTHEIVSAFSFGREDVIPDMFRNIVDSLAAEHPEAWDCFRFYLERHITHDDERHGPLCRRLLGRLCDDDPEKWAAANATARKCIEARIALWDALAARL